MKFENLEEMMSKCPGLIFAVNVLGLTNKQKICQNLKKKKKLSFGFRDEKQGKTVKIREKLEKIREKTSKCPGLTKNLLILLEIGKYCQKKNHIFLNSTNLRLNFLRKFKYSVILLG